MDNPFDFNKEKKHPFKVPENYFQKLPLDINERLPQKKPGFSFFPGGAKWALAAVMTVLIISFFVVRNDRPHSLDMQHYLAEVSDDAIQSYLENEYISTDELMAISDFSDVYSESLLPETVEPEEIEFYELEDVLMLEYEQQQDENF